MNYESAFFKKFKICALACDCIDEMAKKCRICEYIQYIVCTYVLYEMIKFLLGFLS